MQAKPKKAEGKDVKDDKKAKSAAPAATAAAPAAAPEMAAMAVNEQEYNIGPNDVLAINVWKEQDYTLTNVIEVYINILRRKLERPERPPLIHTLRGQGYSLRGE